MNLNDKPKRGRPKRIDKDNTAVSSAEHWTMPGEGRKTYIVNTELANKINEIAHQERTSIKNVVNMAFTSHVAAYETKNGILKLP